YMLVMKKITSGGKERLDGFLSSEFLGITAQEREELVGIFVKDADFQPLSLFLSADEFKDFLRGAVYSLGRCSDAHISALIWADKVGVMNDALINLVMAMKGASNWSISAILSYFMGINVPVNVFSEYKSALTDILEKNINEIITLKAGAELLRLR